jgi:hypothetical protein
MEVTLNSRQIFLADILVPQNKIFANNLQIIQLKLSITDW